MKKLISLLTITYIIGSIILLSGCSNYLFETTKNNNQQIETQNDLTNSDEVDEKTIPDDTQSKELAIDYNADQKLFMEISIDTKEKDLQSIAEKYGYHMDLTTYNAGTNNRSHEKNHMYELYDPSQFKNESEEKYRVNRNYYAVQITYYHANDEEDTQYIVSCVYSKGRSGKLVKQCFDVESNTTEYYYWKQTTTIPTLKDENWHSASSAEEAIINYLSD